MIEKTLKNSQEKLILKLYAEVDCYKQQNTQLKAQNNQLK